MKKNRLEAFSDGVLAIIITIMVLEMKIPKGDNFTDLKEVIPTFISYLFSFVYIGLYWNNHHHLWQAAKKVNGKILWANLHLLFWLSLFPFATGWIGENHITKIPVALYGIILMMSAFAWYILEKLILKEEGPDSPAAKAFKKNHKELISIGVYFIGILLAFLLPIVSVLIYAIVAILWIVPDKRVEKLNT
ncbi:TMEM175 family protein [Zhouia sp. PK063]|uniref:TMEM175 family protein n=1 Tax=Zhouia sp. PK063 TaxID=3373602 RepID=UPI0037A3E0DB